MAGGVAVGVAFGVRGDRGVGDGVRVDVAVGTNVCVGRDV